MPVQSFGNQGLDGRRNLLPVLDCCADERPSDELPVVAGLCSQKILQEVIFRLSIFFEVADIYWRGERLLPVNYLAFKVSELRHKLFQWLAILVVCKPVQLLLGAEVVSPQRNLREVKIPRP